MSGLWSIIGRELAVGARQKGTYRARFLAGGLVLLLFMGFLVVTREGPESIGTELFQATSLLLFLQALVSGLGLTADCLSEEKREGTLGLLFLTELTPAGVVLGKMAARSLRALYSLVAALPVFACCILVGGVQGVDTIYIAIVLLTTLFLSLALGVFVSALATEDKSALFGTLGLIMVFSLLPPVIWAVFDELKTLPNWGDYFLYLSPSYAFWSMPKDPTPENVKEFVICIAALVVIIGLLVWGGAFFLKRSFLEEIAGSKLAPRKISNRRGKAAPRAVLELNPFQWLLSRERFFGRAMWVIGAMALVLSPVNLLSKTEYNWMGDFAGYGLLLLHFIFKFLIASEAIRRFQRDHRSGALEALVTTPLEPSLMLRAQVTGIMVRSLPAMLALMVSSLVLFGPRSNDRVLGVGGAVFPMLDGLALAWLGILQAFKPGRFPVAVLKVMGIVVIGPIVLMTMYVFMAKLGADDAQFYIWHALCAVLDVAVICFARAKLLKNFRTLAASALGAPKTKLSMDRIAPFFAFLRPRAAKLE